MRPQSDGVDSPSHSFAKSLLPGGSGLRASQYWTGRALVRQLSHCAPAWFVYHVIDPLWRAPTWTASLGDCTAFEQSGPSGNLAIKRLQLETKHSTRRRCVSGGSTTTPATDNPNESNVMTLEDAATFLKCCPTTIKRRAKILHIPHKRLGSLWRFYRPDLEAWMRQDAA